MTRRTLYERSGWVVVERPDVDEPGRDPRTAVVREVATDAARRYKRQGRFSLSATRQSIPPEV